MRLSPRRYARIQLQRLNHLLRGPLWFPQVPLALLLALGGLWLLRWDLGAGWRPFVADLLSGHPVLRPRLMPQLLVGIGMMIMALGLVVRSRVAWIMALILALTAVVSLLLAWQAAGGHLLIAYFLVTGLALVAAWRRFNRASLTGSTLFALTSVVMLLLYATFGAYYMGADFKPHIADLITALYYAMVTMSTVGYGDIIPQTPEAKLFTVSIIVLGVAVFATSLTAVVVPLVTRSFQGIVNRNFKRMKRENHFIVIGNTSLAINTWRELARRGQKVTRLLREAPATPQADVDVVVGDPGSVEVLRQAGADKAAAVMAMLDDDSENAFIVLAVRELEGSPQTVVAVNDGRHLSRIKLVQPDVVIAPQILGGELAAMLVTGEEVTSDFVMRRMLQQDVVAGAAPSGPKVE